MLIALGGCLSARPESYVPEGPSSGMPGNPDGGIPEKPDSGIPTSGDTGPRIICSPEELDFGLNMVGIPSTLSIFCTNAGQFVPGHPAPNLFIPDPKTTEPGLAIENGDVAFQPWLDQPFPTAGLAPGETVKINVTYMPTAVGSDADALIISSNDSMHPTTRVSLTGTAKAPLDCDIRPSSGGAGFGHVDRGSDAVLPFDVTNYGTDACGPVTVHLLAGGCSAFSLIGPSGPTNSISTSSVAGGASFEVEIRYAPTTAESLCTAALCVDTPTRSFQCIPFSGSSESGCLLILPNPVDFGTVSLDAGGDQHTVTVQMVCDTQDVEVTSLALVDSVTPPQFFLSGDPTPVVIPKACAGCPPPMPLSFQVSFIPRVTGADTAKLNIFTDESTVPYSIAVIGDADE
jgi:hypothetical protein